PEYPRIEVIFRDEEQARENFAFENLMRDLGLEHHFTAKDKVSYKQLLNAYVQEHPDTSELITGYQQQLLSGLDRQWKSDYIQQLDLLNIHGLLLRSVIRGIGTGYSIPGKSSSFIELYTKYGDVHSQININVKTNFIMPVKQIILSSSDQDEIARKQINLVPIEKVWNSLSNTESFSTGNVL
ncbi:hypothetical protein, partial [Treponema sp. R80B11-R83G3]